eukprot:gene5177-5545_t
MIIALIIVILLSSSIVNAFRSHSVTLYSVKQRKQRPEYQRLNNTSTNGKEFKRSKGKKKETNRVSTQTTEYSSSLIGHEMVYKSYHLNNTDDLRALKEFSKEITEISSNSAAIDHVCHLKKVENEGSNPHRICSYQYSTRNDGGNERGRKCYFLSFGLSDSDFTFETELSNPPYSCRGYAFDPKMDHSLKVNNNLMFLPKAAHSSYVENNINNNNGWDNISIPEFRHFLNQDLFLLKMNCNGCEYSLAYDIIYHDLNFLQHVTQLNLQLHFSDKIIQSENDVYSLGRLYRLLKLSKFTLVHNDHVQCSQEEERRRSSCHPLLIKAGFDCQSRCQRFHFAKLTLSDILQGS